MLLVTRNSNFHGVMKISSTLICILVSVSVLFLIVPAELLSQSNNYTNTQIQQIEQKVLESLIDENNQEFLRNLEELRASGTTIHHELLFYEAKAHRNLSNLQEAFLIIDFYLYQPDVQQNHKNNAEVLRAQLEIDFQELREREEHLYQRILREKQISDVQKYLDQNPEIIRNTAEVEEMRHYLRVFESGSPDKLKTYFSDFPNGLFTDNLVNNIVFKDIEEMPELIGGMAWIANQLEYPELARRAGISGTVVIQIIVDQNGSVTDTEVVRRISPVLEDEALRVIETAQFIPGKQNGIPVRVKLNIPINFGLSD